MTVLYGLVVVLFIYGAVALSLAEMAARYTTAGGQYHWTALLAPEGKKRGIVRLAHSPWTMLTLVTVILLWLYQRHRARRHDCNCTYHRGSAYPCHDRIPCPFLPYRALAYFHVVPGQ